jgi:hypothetical protein
MSTCWAMTKAPSRQGKKDTHGNRQIVGFSLSPARAAEVKVEAAQRRIPLRTLFEEMWELYKKHKKNEK